MKTNIKRNYYIDLIRGFAFILMALDHLIYDIASIFNGYWAYYFPSNHYLNVIVRTMQIYRRSDISGIIRFIFIAFIFLFISGVSAQLSKNNTKRGLRLLLISTGLSIITFIIYLFTKNKSIIIYFGILHCISISMLLTPLFKKINKKVLFMFVIIVIGLGIYFGSLRVNTIFLIPFNLKPFYFLTADYYPLFPFMGIYILGFLFGDWYFNVKKKPTKTKNYRVNIFTYFGKNTLVWYFIHQVALIVFLIIFTLINLIFV